MFTIKFVCKVLLSLLTLNAHTRTHISDSNLEELEKRTLKDVECYNSC